VSFPRRRVYQLSGGGGNRSGVPRAEGRAVVDDSGFFHPLGFTFFWSMQGLKYEADRFRSNAQWVASRGFDFIRILAEVAWEGNRRIDPTQPEWSDWAQVLSSVIDYVYDELGMRVQITIRGKGTATDHMWLARQVGSIVSSGRAHKIMLIEMENEYTAVAGDPLEELSAMAAHLRSATPNLLALSTPGDEAEAKAIKAEALRLGLGGFTYHIDRGTGDSKWRQVRQGYDMKEWAPLVASSNEPPGPASSVATNENPLQLAMMRAVGVICGGACFVFHTGSGVFGDGKSHPSAGPRPANFWEIADIDAMVSAVRGIDKLLPEGVENWSVANTQWQPPNPVAPFQPHNHWEGDDGDGVNKAYSALAPDGRFIQLPCGVRGHATMRASYAVREVTVFDPISLQPVDGLEGRSFAAGESFELAGGGHDAMKAYVILGRRS
jgi:hypothetical protein